MRIRLPFGYELVLHRPLAVRLNSVTRDPETGRWIYKFASDVRPEDVDRFYRVRSAKNPLSS